MSKKYFYKIINIALVFSFLFVININSLFAQIGTEQNPTVEEEVVVTSRIPSAVSKNPDFTDVGGIIKNFNKNIVQNLVILLSGIAVAVFLWGLVRFIYDRARGNSENLKKDKMGILWGLGALFILVTLWGIIKLVQGIVGVSGDNNINLPKICADGSCTTSSKPPTDNGITGNTGSGGSTDVTDKLGSTQNTAPSIENISKWPEKIGPGENSDNVWQLQNFLKSNRYPNTMTDGKYGSNTVTNVKAFQTANKLVADGVVGPSTKAVILYIYLRAIPSNNAQILSWTNLGEGARGTQVKELQTLLNIFNCYNPDTNSNEDSIFGPATKAAVKSFQTVNSLVADGIVGPSTKAVIVSDDTFKCN